jgi:hypothetical protein
MTLLLLAVVATMKPIDFPAQPIATELLRGEKVYYQRRGLERVLAEDRVVIGTWFDGRIKRDVEDVTWVSPSLVSRWLGYLNAQEKWPYAELIGRWQALRARLGGRMTFVAQLSALPRRDPLDLAEEANANFEDALDARFLVTHDLEGPAPATEAHLEDGALTGKAATRRSLMRYEPLVTALGSIKAYDWRSLFATKWYQLSADFEPLLPEFQLPYRPDPYRNRLGDHLTVIYRVEAPLPDRPLAAAELQVRVFTKRHERAAHFSLRNPRFAQ